MRRIAILWVVWLISCVNCSTFNSRDEIMQTSEGHEEAFQDGQLVHVLSNLIDENIQKSEQEQSQHNPLERTFCCIFGSDSDNEGKGMTKGKKGGKSETGGHKRHQQQQYGPPPQQFQQQYGPPPPQKSQQYGPPPQQQYGPPPNQQQYGPPPQSNQQYGVPNSPVGQPLGQQYGPPPQQPQQQYGQPQPPSIMVLKAPLKDFFSHGLPPKKYKHKFHGTKQFSFNFPSFGERTKPRQKPSPPKIFGAQQTTPNFQQNNFQQNFQPLPQIQAFTIPPQNQNFQPIQPPQNNYGPPQNNYGPPPTQPAPVQETYQPPQTTYQPQDTYQAPQNDYAAPQQQEYGPPQQQEYAAPQPQAEYGPQQEGNRFVYIYGPPANLEQPEPPLPPQKVPHTKQTNYQVVFIRAPNPPKPQQLELELPPPPERKTQIYVLVKKPQKQQEIKFTKPPTTPPPAPEVFFIKYKNGQKQQQSQQQYGLPSTSEAQNYIEDVQDTREVSGEYGVKIRAQRSQPLPSTSSEFARQLAEEEDEIEIGGNRRSGVAGSLGSHYQAPGAIPWK